MVYHHYNNNYHRYNTNYHNDDDDDVIGIEILLQYYPSGVSCKDNKNITPYDIVLKWKHSSSIKRLLLDIEPDLDKITYLILKYGPFAKIYYCFYKPQYTCNYDHYENNNDNNNNDNSNDNNGHNDNNNNDNSYDNNGHFQESPDQISHIISWNGKSRSGNDSYRGKSNKVIAISKDEDHNDYHHDDDGVHQYDHHDDDDGVHQYDHHDDDDVRQYDHQGNVVNIAAASAYEDENDHHDSENNHDDHINSNDNDHCDVAEVTAFNDD